MKCPFCSHKHTRVIDKRDSADLSSTRRRRECERCKKRFTTYERVELINIFVIKKNGSRQPFDREKIKRGIVRSCEKRMITIDQIDRLVDQIESKVRSRNQKEIRSPTIGQMVMAAIRRLDEVAFIRFASVYRSFEDIDSFEKELRKLKEVRTPSKGQK
ncbi:MAG: transcriptional regulator NrdR [archaeon]